MSAHGRRCARVTPAAAGAVAGRRWDPVRVPGQTHALVAACGDCSVVASGPLPWLGATALAQPRRHVLCTRRVRAEAPRATRELAPAGSATAGALAAWLVLGATPWCTTVAMCCATPAHPYCRAFARSTACAARRCAVSGGLGRWQRVLVPHALATECAHPRRRRRRLPPPGSVRPQSTLATGRVRLRLNACRRAARRAFYFQVSATCMRDIWRANHNSHPLVTTHTFCMETYKGEPTFPRACTASSVPRVVRSLA